MPLIQKFLHARKYIGFGFSKLKLGAKIHSTISRKKFKLSADFSSFDSSVDKRLIKMAFKVLRTHFVLNDSDQALWEKLEDEFINTKFLMPDGNIYQKSSGVPSGSYFTQLVDSIITATVMVWALQAMKFTGPAEHLLVLGDDSLFGSDERVNLKYISKLLAKCGLELSVKKSRDDCHFLGGVWDKLEKREDPRLIATKMLYPERFRVYPDLRGSASMDEVRRASRNVICQYLTV